MTASQILFILCIFFGFSLSEEEFEEETSHKGYVTAIIVVSSSLSLLASAMVIGAYAVAKSKFPIQQRHVLHAVLFLAISDFLSALSWLGSYADTSCLFAGIVKIFFFSMSELGTVAFAAAIFLVVLDKDYCLNSRNWIKFLIIAICIFVSTVRAATAAFLDVTGKEEYWCWFTSESSVSVQVIWDIPGFIILCIDLSLYIAIYFRLKKLRKESLDMSARRSKSFKFIGRISSILLVYLLCWITYPLDAILHLTAPKYAIYAQIIASFLVPLQGFMNGLVYGVTLYSKQFKLCKKEVNEAEEIESTQFNQTIAPA